MKLLTLAALLIVVTAVGGASMKAVWQFGNMISCLIPNITPSIRFNKYGCYCGMGGKGTPVDELDRCCQTHDNCWGEAVNSGLCTSFLPILGSPYVKWYTYSCSESGITCSSENDPCKDFVCNCDRAAAMCFAKAPYNKEYLNLDRDKYCGK
uniref:Phospholipase A2 n=1 Tax=Blarina brevicauda TaxID=9387 RepID=A0A7D4WZ68_BLABR|nr:phospholipase A2 [Blarina brevicauda]